MLLTLPSGKAIPVNYLRDGDTVYAAADFPWWRELRGEQRAADAAARQELAELEQLRPPLEAGKQPHRGSRTLRVR